MTIYQRHIIRHIVRYAVIVVCIIVGIVWLGQVMKLIYLFDRGVAFLDFCYLTVLVLPSLLFSILPLGVSVGIVIGYNILSNDRELIVLSSSGVSVYDLIKPAIFVASFFTIIAYSISLYLLPVSYTRLKVAISVFRDGYVANLIQNKTFTAISKNITIYTLEKDNSGLLKGVVFFEKERNGSLSILSAKSGRIHMDIEHPYYELHDGVRQIVDKNGKIQQMSFANIAVAIHKQKICDQGNSSDGCNVSNAANKTLQEYFISELFYNGYDMSQSKKVRLKSEGHQRIIWPLYNILLTGLSVVIFLCKPYNRRGNSKILSIASLSSILFLVIHFAIYSVSAKIEVVNLGLYVNVAVCFATTVYLIMRASRRM